VVTLAGQFGFAMSGLFANQGRKEVAKNHAEINL